MNFTKIKEIYLFHKERYLSHAFFNYLFVLLTFAIFIILYVLKEIFARKLAKNVRPLFIVASHFFFAFLSRLKSGEKSTK